MKFGTYIPKFWAQLEWFEDLVEKNNVQLIFIYKTIL